MGTVMTTGIPSGTISIGTSHLTDVQVSQTYELKQNSKPWKDEESVTFKYQAAAETSMEDPGAEEETSEFTDFLEPSEFRPAPLGKMGPKLKSNSGSDTSSISLPRTQIVLAVQALAPHRDTAIGHLTEQAVYGPGVSYSGTLFQPPTSRVAPLQSYREEWWQQHSEGSLDTLDPFWIAQFGGESSSIAASTDSSVGLPAQPAAEPVPEPAGVLALMAGLPGIAMLMRYRKSPVAG